MRKTLKAKGYEQRPVTFIVETRGHKVWVNCFDSPFDAQAILEADEADNLADLLTQAVKELRA